MMPLFNPVGLISILLMLLLSPPQTPKQPLTSQTVYQYILPQADLVLTGDSAPWLEGLWERIDALDKTPLFTQIPMLAASHQGTVADLKRRHAGLVREVGFDPLKHFRWGTISLKFEGLGSPPNFLVALGGDITAEVIQAIVKQIPPNRTSKQVGSWTVVLLDRRGTFAGAAAVGQPLLVGSLEAITAATQGRLESPPNSLASQARGSFQTGACFHLALGRLPTALAAQLSLMAPPAARSFLPLLLDLEGASVAAYPNDTLELSVRSNKPDTLARYRLLLEALGSFVIAGDYTTRGLIKMLDGLISSNPEHYPDEIRPFLASKSAIFDVIQKRIGSQQARYELNDVSGQTAIRLSNLGGSSLMSIGLFAIGGASAFLPRRLARRLRRMNRSQRPVPPPTPAFPPSPPAIPEETPASRPSK